MEELFRRIGGKCSRFSSESRLITNAGLGSTGTAEIPKIRPSWWICESCARSPAHNDQGLSLFVQILRCLCNERQENPDEKRRIGCGRNAVSDERSRHQRVPHRR